MNVSWFAFSRVAYFFTMVVGLSVFAGCSSHDTMPTPFNQAAQLDTKHQAKIAAATPSPSGHDHVKSGFAKNRFDQISQGGDYSNDICTGNCVIDGQVISLDFGDAWQQAAPDGATSVQFFVDQPAASSGVNVSFSAPTASPPFSESLILNSYNGHGPGVFPYDYYAVWTLADGSTIQSDKLYSVFQVACSRYKVECPFGIITDSALGSAVDNRSRSNPVVIAAGQEIPLTASVTNVGSYSFTIQNASNTSWSVPGDVLKNYDIDNGIAVSLDDSNTIGNSIDFYMLRDTDDKNGTQVSFSSIATRSDGNETAYVYATAPYIAQIPAAQGYDTESTPAYGSRLLATSFALGQNTLNSNSNYTGYNYEFSIATPNVSGGEFGILKDIYSTIRWTPDSSSYAHGTNGQIMLYDCPFPQSPVQASAGSNLLMSGGNTFGLHIGLAATGKTTYASREDYLDNTLLFKPTPTSVRRSIWTPITAIGLHWGAAASVNATGLAWSALQAPNSDGGPFAYESYSADRDYEPTWTAVFTEPFDGPALDSPSPGPCASTS